MRTGSPCAPTEDTDIVSRISTSSDLIPPEHAAVLYRIFNGVRQLLRDNQIDDASFMASSSARETNLNPNLPSVVSEAFAHLHQQIEQGNLPSASAVASMCTIRMRTARKGLLWKDDERWHGEVSKHFDGLLSERNRSDDTYNNNRRQTQREVIRDSIHKLWDIRRREKARHAPSPTMAAA